MTLTQNSPSIGRASRVGRGSWHVVAPCSHSLGVGELLQVRDDIEQARVWDPSGSADLDRSESPVPNQLVDAAASKPESISSLLGCQEELRHAAAVGVG